MKSILDPTFRYTNAASTDIRKTFARIKRERDKEREAEAARIAASNVKPIREKKV